MCSLGENPATGDPFTVENRFPELGFASVITPVGFQLARYLRQLAFPDWPKLETCIALLPIVEICDRAIHGRDLRSLDNKQ